MNSNVVLLILTNLSLLWFVWKIYADSGEIFGNRIKGNLTDASERAARYIFLFTLPYVSVATWSAYKVLAPAVHHLLLGDGLYSFEADKFSELVTSIILGPSSVALFFFLSNSIERFAELCMVAKRDRSIVLVLHRLFEGSRVPSVSEFDLLLSHEAPRRSASLRDRSLWEEIQLLDQEDRILLWRIREALRTQSGASPHTEKA